MSDDFSRHLPGNPFAGEVSRTPETMAILALAYEQRKRNELAALTYERRTGTVHEGFEYLFDTSLTEDE